MAEPEPLAINLNAPHWLWTRGTSATGYGWYAAKRTYAHRYFWEVMRGPIPEDLEIDHLCRNKLCVNPQHLEVVTHQLNSARGMRFTVRALRQTCERGHPYTEENTYITYRGGRSCRACQRIHGATYRAKKR
jgi:hypothetical protein